MSAPPSPPSPDLEPGRRAYRRREWRSAFELLNRAEADYQLEPTDLWLLATSAFLIGREADFLAALESAHHRHLARGEPGGAARSAFWMGMHLGNRGEGALASGWFGRAARILDRDGGEYVERGYLLLADAMRHFAEGAPAAAARCAVEAVEFAERFGDPELLAFALHLQGRALVGAGRVAEGLALIDEAMVAVATDELSPQVTGFIYCSVLGACRSIQAVSRAQAWSEALSDWCERQPQMVAYTGECRVYRAELMHLHGHWDDAISEARRAREIAGGAGSATALALYQEGEVQRLRGDFAAAGAAYLASGSAGREPQPGLALLRLAQRDRKTAIAAIRRALVESEDPLRRTRLLPAHVEIALATGEIVEARSSCAELQELAERYDSPVLNASASYTLGAVALASGSPIDALPHLRSALRLWGEVVAPYEAARARVAIALACRELADEDAAAAELRAARACFERLRAEPDLSRVDALLRPSSRRSPHGLTTRELEVLALLATGTTNRAIARALHISEKTVARHVSNIFRKLQLGSRAAATAYAYEHDLL